MNRLHEFSKIEIVRIDKPEHSEQSHQEMLAHVEGLLQKLELPYRILRLCGGDMSFTSSICYDFEVYSEAQKRWLEVSSVSNFDTYQANRLQCRYRGADTLAFHLCVHAKAAHQRPDGRRGQGLIFPSIRASGTGRSI